MKVLLIQYRTDASAAHERDCVLRHTGLRHHELEIRNPVLRAGTLNEISARDYNAVLLGGSGEYSICRHKPEMQRIFDEVRPLLDEVVRHDQPFLGMCLGHQVLAWHLGGKVATDPSREEVGSLRITVTEAGTDDPIFADLPRQFIAQHGHKDSVVALPGEACHLATGEKSRFNAYRIGRHVYALQFHPELDLDDLMTRLALYPSYLHGRTLEEARRDFQESPDAPRVMRNFMAVVRRRREKK